MHFLWFGRKEWILTIQERVSLNGSKRRGLILWNIAWWTAKIWKKQYSIFQIKFPQMIFRPMDWWHYTMILPMEILSEVPQSFQEMHLLLNGKMKSVRQR